MEFKPIKYMEWMKTRGLAKYELCPSGVSHLSLKELGIDMEALGGRINRLNRKYEQGYGFDLDEFEKHLSGRVKFVLLTNLHNPSGVSLSFLMLRDRLNIKNR